MTKITTDGMSHAPVWTPEGKTLRFRSWRLDRWHRLHIRRRRLGV
jgi:hypothetical protein